MFKFKSYQMFFTTLCVLAQCVYAAEYLRGSGSGGGNKSPSPEAKDTSEWTYLLYVVLGSAVFVGSVLIGKRSRKRSRSSSSRSNRADSDEDDDEGLTWGIEGMPKKNFYDLQVHQKRAVLEKHGTSGTKKTLSGKKKFLGSQLEVLAQNDSKVTKMNNAIVASIPTKEELKARKQALAAAKLVPNVQHAPGSTVVFLQICVSCAGGLDIPDGCYEELIDWMYDNTIKGAVGIEFAGRKEGSQSHKHLQCVVYMSLYGATKKSFNEVRKRIREALPSIEASTASVSVTPLNRKGGFTQTPEACLGYIFKEHTHAGK